MNPISPSTQATLLLTAPLIAGRDATTADLLSPGEFNRFDRMVREWQREPADLLGADAGEILEKARFMFDRSRLQSLLGRGFLLSQAIERWDSALHLGREPNRPGIPATFEGSFEGRCAADSLRLWRRRSPGMWRPSRGWVEACRC